MIQSNTMISIAMSLLSMVSSLSFAQAGLIEPQIVNGQIKLGSAAQALERVVPGYKIMQKSFFSTDAQAAAKGQPMVVIGHFNKIEDDIKDVAVYIYKAKFSKAFIYIVVSKPGGYVAHKVLDYQYSRLENHPQYITPFQEMDGSTSLQVIDFEVDEFGALNKYRYSKTLNRVVEVPISNIPGYKIPD